MGQTYPYPYPCISFTVTCSVKCAQQLTRPTVQNDCRNGRPGINMRPCGFCCRMPRQIWCSLSSLQVLPSVGHYLFMLTRDNFRTTTHYTALTLCYIYNFHSHKKSLTRQYSPLLSPHQPSPLPRAKSHDTTSLQAKQSQETAQNSSPSKHPTPFRAKVLEMTKAGGSACQETDACDTQELA